jgi:hypothetical protein
LLLEHAEHGLRVFLGGQLAEHGFRDLQALCARCLRPAQQVAVDPAGGAAGEENQRLGLPAGITGADEDGSTFGNEQPGLATRLAHLQRANELHTLVLQTGDRTRTARGFRARLHGSTSG